MILCVLDRTFSSYIVGSEGSGAMWLSRLLLAGSGSSLTEDATSQFVHVARKLEPHLLTSGSIPKIIVIRNPFSAFLSQFRKKIERDFHFDTHHTYLDRKVMDR